MKNYRKIIHTWGIFHITFIVMICSYSTYHKYCRFYGVSESHLVNKINASLFFLRPIRYYGKFTGAGAGYGFFAPNIKSNGIIIGDCDGKKISARFTGFEAMMRFSILSSRITDYLLNGEDTLGISGHQLQEQYYDLVFKSIAVKIYNQNNCTTDTLYMSYNIIEFPGLRNYKLGHNAYSLKKIKEIRIVKQK